MKPDRIGPTENDDATPAQSRQRLDLWLWHARILRTRKDAAEFVRAGHVRIGGMRVTTPSHAVRAGNVLTVALDRRVRVLEVRGFSARRGDADATAGLYREINHHEAAD